MNIVFNNFEFEEPDPNFLIFIILPFGAFKFIYKLYKGGYIGILKLPKLIITGELSNDIVKFISFISFDV